LDIAGLNGGHTSMKSITSNLNCSYDFASFPVPFNPFSCTGYSAGTWRPVPVQSRALQLTDTMQLSKEYAWNKT